jgi:hypothetical protein
MHSRKLRAFLTVPVYLPPRDYQSNIWQKSPPRMLITLWRGKKARGRLGVINGGTKFFVEFQSGGIAVMGTAEEGTTFRGTWTQSGNTVTMKAGASTFSGTLQGNRLSGTRSRKNARTLKDTVDTWELTLEK